MPSKHVFSGVTLEVLRHLQADDDAYELELEPDRIVGKFIKHTAMGDIVVNFEHNDERAEMTVVIMKKPMLVPTPMVLAEMSLALRQAAEEAAKAAATQPAAGND